ncbi:sporulation protein [Baekduia alba]|uniref:CAP domain-containing protein n=1 Tax=Baekduia alba TaxID=2997333 RepID=UPI00234147D2|nr:CAP domain-containing protein [Baekduia alba]WCB96553.1 sporulation protein [Baekduia alba]
MIAIAAGACATGAPVASAAAPPASCAGADAVATPANVAQTRAAIACLIDAARAGRGAPALRRDARLRVAAQRFAATLDPAKPLTHTGSGGSSPLDRVAKAGYGRGTFSAGEALGRSTDELATPTARVKAWLADPQPRRLLLSAKYRDVGIGVVTRGTVTTFVVDVARRDS